MHGRPVEPIDQPLYLLVGHRLGQVEDGLARREQRRQCPDGFLGGAEVDRIWPTTRCPHKCSGTNGAGGAVTSP